MQLNASKTEALWVGSRFSLAKLSNRDDSIQIATSTIRPLTVIRDLGVYLDSELSMKQHIAKVAALCLYHLRCLCQNHRRVSSKVTTHLILALIMSRLDYCTLVLACLPLATIAALQLVQNTAARLIFELGTREHVTASLLQLHCLPVHWQVRFKLCCLMYLTNVVSPIDFGHPHHGL